MKTEIDIPKGCTHISIEIVEGKIFVSYASDINEDEIECKETGRKEALPKAGDFCIMWNPGRRAKAVCVNCISRTTNGFFVSSSGQIYKRAIRFRDYEQYLNIKGRSVDEL